jgi:hypothetical protein
MVSTTLTLSLVLISYTGRCRYRAARDWGANRAVLRNRRLQCFGELGRRDHVGAAVSHASDHTPSKESRRPPCSQVQPGSGIDCSQRRTAGAKVNRRQALRRFRALWLPVWHYLGCGDSSGAPQSLEVCSQGRALQAPAQGAGQGSRKAGQRERASEPSCRALPAGSMGPRQSWRTARRMLASAGVAFTLDQLHADVRRGLCLCRGLRSPTHPGSREIGGSSTDLRITGSAALQSNSRIRVVAAARRFEVAPADRQGRQGLHRIRFAGGDAERALAAREDEVFGRRRKIQPRNFRAGVSGWRGLQIAGGRLSMYEEAPRALVLGACLGAAG